MRLTSQSTPVKGRNDPWHSGEDQISSCDWASVLAPLCSGREVIYPLLGASHVPKQLLEWQGLLGIRNPTVHCSLPLYLLWRDLWTKLFDNFLGAKISMHTGQREAAEHSTHCSLGPHLLARHLLPWTPALVLKPSFFLPAHPRPLPDTCRRAEAQPANDSQMLLNSCKNTVSKWTTWHLGLLVFLPVKRSPQESALSSFTDRNAPWKILHKHKRLAIQCRAVFPHNFV